MCVEGTQSVGQFVGGRGDGGGQTLSSCVLVTLRLPLGAVLRLMGKGVFLRYKESRFTTTLSLRACSVPGSEEILRPDTSPHEAQTLWSIPLVFSRQTCVQAELTMWTRSFPSTRTAPSLPTHAHLSWPLPAAGPQLNILFY